jgi:hypothetical protein
VVLGVFVWEAVPVIDALSDSDAVLDGEGESVEDGVALADAEPELLVVGDSEGVAELLDEAVIDGVPVTDGVSLGEAVFVEDELPV